MPHSSTPDYSQLSALFLNCTLKRSDRLSHTAGLIHLSKMLMEKQGVTVEEIRPVDYNIPPGVQPDMTQLGFERDDWPTLFEKVLEADILVIGTPIWLGEKSSIATRVIERLYSNSGFLNAKGQSVFYGRVGGAIATGNEDGGKNCATQILYALAHLGYTIPPQADAVWLGEAGPGPSYLDENSGGPENDFTNRNTTIMTWNLMHLASILKQNHGYPAEGNNRNAWAEGERFGFENPYR